MANHLITARNYAVANAAAARIIMADPERYQGLMRMWAELVLERKGKE